MTKVKVATFNCENLFARYRFNDNVNPENAIINGWLPDITKFSINSPEEKKLTSLAIKETNADVIALQEVENLQVLRRFRNDYLEGTRPYKYLFLSDGNDPRLIDVAILSKYPIEKMDTHIHEFNNEIRALTFSRDCLECDIILPNNKKIRFYINHFKSMMDRNNPCQGRSVTRKKRQIQSHRVREIVSEEFSNTVDDDNGSFIILGDFNDYPETDSQGPSGITELVDWEMVENVINRLPESERWTHYFKGKSECGIPEVYRQLDYILVSKHLAQKNQNVLPQIVRKGLPLRANKYQGERFPGVGNTNPKASDHCPVVIELEI